MLLEAKKKYEKSKAAVDELVAAGIMTEAEAAKVIFFFLNSKVIFFFSTP